MNLQYNDKLSKMKGFDLQEFLLFVDDYAFELRERLGFDSSMTFGFELEFEHAIRYEITRKLYDKFQNEEWKLKNDSSLDDGAEINSPILKDEPYLWDNLKTVCSIVSEHAMIGKKSGGHIHIGTQALGDQNKSWLNFIKLWSVYENVIYRFVYGEFLTARPQIVKYAEPLSKTFWNDYQTLKGSGLNTTRYIVESITHLRDQAVNFHKVKFNHYQYEVGNTIEFRCPNGSLNPVIWQNNTNLFLHLLSYCKSDQFNNDIIMKRHRQNQDYDLQLSDYNEIYLDQALELSDLLFSNNLDKVYFLKQYLKSFQVDPSMEEYEVSPKIKKKR